MVVSKVVKGTRLLTNTFQMIYPDLDDDHIRDPRWTEGWIFLHDMTAGDQIQIKVSAYDETGQQMRIYDQPIIIGQQDPVSAFHIGAVLSLWLRIEVSQIAAPSSFKSINFTFYEVS
jgi:hypothetical protein